MSRAGEAVERAFRDEWSALLAGLIARVRDFQLAEDALADAFATAATAWERDGIPGRPAAWLATTARNRAIDRLRRDRVLADRVRRLEADAERAGDAAAEDDDMDERLRLVFTCCHPALAPEARIALTLRAVGGLTTAEIARAFLVSEPTMYQRLTRARKRIADAGIPYRIPSPEDLPERLAGVLRVVYLIFNEAHGADRGDLAAEAIRLARLLTDLMPDEPEVRGLLALLLLLEARRASRVQDGRFVSLEHQDRGAWNRALIDEGLAELHRGGRHRRLGPYQLQAAIAAEHTGAPSFDATNWKAIVGFYDALLRIDPSPVIAVNRAAALSYAEGPDSGLTALETLAGDARLGRYAPLHAALGELRRRTGDRAGADAAYARAIALTENPAERVELERRRNA